MKYIDYDVIDFVLDEDFKQWVIAPNADNNAFWESWISENPEKTEVVRQAKQMIRLIHFKKDHPENHDFQDVWNNIQQAVKEPESRPHVIEKVAAMSVRQTVPSGRLFSYKYAAVITGLLFLSMAFWYGYAYYGKNITVSTAYGELKTVELPDHSVVKLNANSQITYNRQWNVGQPREVWLKGEAFFSVTHQANHAPFVVHTDHLEVEVLGTEFNVDQREDKTRIVLNSGKVKVDFQDRQVVEMEPGELLAYSYLDSKIMKTKVDVEKETAWRNNQLIYEDTPIAEVIADIERQFGIDIKVEQDTVLQHKFTGVIPADNAEAFFITVEHTFNVRLIRKENHITIKANE